MSSSSNPLTTTIDASNLAKLKKLIEDYKKHLSPKISTEKFSELSIHNEIDEDKSVDMPRRKLSEVDDLESLLDVSVDAFLLKYAVFEADLAQVTGKNPLTRLHIWSTHGKQLDTDIRKIIPNLDQNPAYLVGKLNYALTQYSEFYKYKTLDDTQADLVKRCDNLNAALHDTTSLQKSIFLFSQEYPKFLEEAKKIEDQKTGFFASVTKTLSKSPEMKLLDVVFMVNDNINKAGLKPTTAGKPLNK